MRRETGKNLEDQIWYHGTLPRKVIEALLRDDGMFLVRVSSAPNKQLRPIISVKSGGIIFHVPIESNARRQWHLEGEAFQTIYELIRHYHKTLTPITRSTGATLRTAVKREKWMLDDRQVKSERKLGEGAFGEVWLGKLKRDKEEMEVAIKSVKDSLAMSDEERMTTVQEAKQMFQYKHENVVSLYGIAANRPPIRIVMEYCPAGSLDQHLKKETKPGLKKLKYCLEAAKGMEYLASQKCIHRDLAARNCLIGKREEVKISDFGLSKRASEYKLKRGAKLAIRWTAPESLEVGKFSEASDVWSYGVLMWEIFADAAMPWPGVKTNTEVFNLVKNNQKMEAPRGTPTEAYKVMVKCWNRTAKNRPSFQQLVKLLADLMTKTQPTQNT